MKRSTIHSAPKFDPGLDIHFDRSQFRFLYGEGSFGPAQPEIRKLDDIRTSLLDPGCTGPENIYSIAMDVGRREHLPELKRRMLLYGVVAYSSGQLGNEPVRSQGHIHRISPHCGWSTPELVEVWQGRAIVYLQKEVADVPDPCLAIEAIPGDLVLIPPAWAHYIVNANPDETMVFGAFCDREYGFVYKSIRERGGLAWFPVCEAGGRIGWKRNPKYGASQLMLHRARSYPELSLDADLSIYEQFARNPESLQWVSEPGKYAHLWDSFGL
jgi:glucose-6-phosphate isomerase